MAALSDGRTLVLGLGAPTQGNNSIGVRLARSMSAGFRGVDVRPAMEFVSFVELLHDYDLIVVLNSISFCSNVGRVSRGSPYSLSNGWGAHPAHAETFEAALAYARLMGHHLPRVEVVNVCVGSEEWPESGLSPRIASMYRQILRRVRSLVKQIIRETYGIGRKGPSGQALSALQSKGRDTS